MQQSIDTPTASLRVGVVIPSYNCAHFIGEAVESVLAQTYPISRIVVVDDGSSDDCAGALMRFGPIVDYVRINNSGPAHARNVGVARLDTDLVAFLDADDVWLPNKTARQVNRFLSEDCALVYCGKSLIDKDGHDKGAFGQSEFPEGHILNSFLSENPISSTSLVMLKRSVFNEFSGFKDAQTLRISEDYELWARIATRYAIGVVPEALVKYRVHATNTTHNMEGRYVGKIAALSGLEEALHKSGSVSFEVAEKIARYRAKTHAHFARGFLYARKYDKAKLAVKALLLSPAKALEKDLLATHILPIWALRAIHKLRRH